MAQESTFTAEIPRQLAARDVPQPLIDGFSRVDAAAQGELTNVGVDLGAQILASLPEAVRPTVEPFIGAIVDGIHDAFSVAIGSAMWLAMVASVAALIVVVTVIPEIPLRRSARDGAGDEERAPSIIPVME